MDEQGLNRTFYGIETIWWVRGCDPGHRLNRTFYGIETIQERKMIRLVLNRTFYGIETVRPDKTFLDIVLIVPFMELKQVAEHDSAVRFLS